MYFSSAEDAAEWYADQLRKKQRMKAGLDEAVTENLITVADWSKILMRKRAGGQVVKGTWQNDGHRFRDYINPLAGHRLLQSMKAPEWEKVLDEIQSDPRKVVSMRLSGVQSDEERTTLEKKIKRHKTSLSNTTRNLVRALLHTMYEEAIREKIAFMNPISQVEVKDQGDPEEKVDFWESQNECKRYLAEHLDYAREIGNYSWYVWAMWSLGKGPRVGELLALSHADIDVLKSRVRIHKIYDPYDKAIVNRTKGSRRSKKGGRKRSSRWLYLNEPMLQAYKLLWETTPYKKQTDSLFLNSRTPRWNHINKQSNRLGLSGITRVHKLICKRAKVKVLRVHDLRHTFGAHFVMNGGSLRALADILGHSTTWVTERYGHLSESYLEKETDRVRFDIEITDNVTPIRAADTNDAGRDA